MRLDSGKYQRHPLRLEEYDYSRAGAYFITVCTKDHENILGEIVNGSMRLNPFGEIVEACWEGLPSRYPDIELDAFVVMPNHIHGIIIISVGAIHELPLREAPARDDTAMQSHRSYRRRMVLPRIIGYVKMNTARRVNQLRNTPGTSVWQRNYYEHVIRNNKSLNSIRQYISENPQRWALDEENPVNIPAR